MGPVVLLVVNKESKVGLDPLVVLFRLSICSGVVGGRDVLCNPQYATHFPCEFGCESGVSVADNLVREPKAFEYVSDKESCHFFQRNSLVAGNKQCCFSTIVVGDCQDRIVPLGGW